MRSFMYEIYHKIRGTAELLNDADICPMSWVVISSGDDFLHVYHQAISRNNAELLLVG